MVKFQKMHGIGNDFAIIDARTITTELTKDQIRYIANRHTGIGCDQVIILMPAQSADIFMKIYNPDGSESATCGNATRCVADLIMSETKQTSCRIETQAGSLACQRVAGGFIAADMGPPKLDWTDIPLAHACDTLNLPISLGNLPAPTAVSMGNPHCVFFVDTIDDVPVDDWGPRIEHHALFPQRTNVEFVQIMGRDRLRLRTWERGAGLTLACGSAACASLVAAVRRGFVDRSAEIVLDGGSLFLEWRASDQHVIMTGPVAYVFEGTLNTI
jgi:diaminopimelate epimerase